MQFSAADMQFMRTAMELAECGQFTAAPNPLVGCVIVSTEGRIIGEGWHTAYRSSPRRSGSIPIGFPCRPAAARPKARGTSPSSPATTLAKPLLVPPSSNASNQSASSSALGIQILRLQEEELNASELRAYRSTSAASRKSWRGRTVVFFGMRKPSARGSSSNGPNPVMAIMDGRPPQERQPGAGGFPITAEAARPLTHTWRALEQGIAVGANTALVDTPLLNVRSIEAPSPRIVLLDPDGHISFGTCIDSAQQQFDSHVVGSTKDPATKHTCYWEVKGRAGCLARKALHRIQSLQLVDRRWRHCPQRLLAPGRLE